MSAIRERRLNLLGYGVALLLVVALAFFLGRRSAVPSLPETGSHSETAETGHEHGEEGHGEGKEGVIRFEEAALKLAGLRVEPVNYRSIQARLPVTGTVEPNQRGVVQVTPRVAGKITAVTASVGDTVRAGQTLARLASTELAAAQAQYRQAGVRVQAAQSHLRRQRQLAGLGEFGQPKVEEARARQVEVQGQVANFRSELSEAQHQVTEARSEKAALDGEVAAAVSAVATAQSSAASAESEIAEAEAQVQAVRAALEQAQTQVKVTQSRFNRYDTLLKEELVSRQDWEQAQADYQRSQSDVTAARANITQAQAKVTTARARLKAAQSQIRAAEARVRADQGRVQQSTTRIATAVAHEEQVASQVRTAERQAQIAAEALDREEQIYRGGLLTNKEIVEAETALQTARAEQQAAASTVRLLGGTPGGGNLLAITAPLAGRVTERQVTLGETVGPTKPLFTVMNLNSVWVQLAVPPRELSLVRVGQAVTVTSDAVPGQSFSGSISHISDLVDETTRTVNVRAVIQNRGGLLKPQTFVRGTIAAPVRSQALAVPGEAVQQLEGKTVLFIAGAHEGEFEAKEVETEEATGGLTLITSGLEPGARVVTKGAFTVKAQAMKAELGHEH